MQANAEEKAAAAERKTLESFVAAFVADATALDWVPEEMKTVEFYTAAVHAIQAQRDDRAMGRPNARAIRPLPKWAQFRAEALCPLSIILSAMHALGAHVCSAIST